MFCSLYRRSLLLALACVLPALAHGQSSIDTALSSLQARLGPDISPDEQAYFGLFFPFRHGFEVARATAEGDTLVLNVRFKRNGSAADTTYRLSAADATTLAQYVESYERYAWEGTARHAEVFSTLIRRRLARPAALPAGALRRVEIMRTDGRKVEGGLLYASETYWALWTELDPYEARRAAEAVVWIPATSIADARASSPETGLRYGEAVLQGGFQIASASPGAAGLDKGVVGPLVSSVVTAGVLTILQRLRPTRSREGSNADQLPRARPLFRTTLPPELRDALANQPPTTARPPLPARPRRSYLEVTLGTSYSTSAGGGTYETRATGTGSNFVTTGPATYSATNQVRTRRSALHLDVQVNPLSFLYAGAEVSVFRDTPEPEYGESFAGMKVFGAFAGVSLRGRSRVSTGHVLSVGGGLQEVRARVTGSFYSTLAFQSLSPERNAALIYRYDDQVQVRRPFARLAYEYLLTDLTSFFVKATVAPATRIEQPRRSHETSTLSNTFSAERPAHALRVSSSAVIVGTRLRF